MDECRKIDDAEFERDWKPVFERVFKKDVAVGQKESPFVDPSWRAVPMPSNPISGYWSGDSTRPDDYPPIEPYFPDYYDPLYLTLAEFGISQIVVDPYGLSHRMLFPPSHEGASAVLRAHEGTDYLVALTSREVTWGLICDWDELAMLGGTPEFIETFYRIGGGERAVQARYLYFLFGNPGTELPNADFFTPKYYSDRQALVYMYQQAGWPFPTRWFGWYGEEIDWSWMMDDEGFPEN